MISLWQKRFLDSLIDKNKCDGCGLCIINCPRDAIEMLNTGKFLDMYLKYERKKS